MATRLSPKAELRRAAALVVTLDGGKFTVTNSNERAIEGTARRETPMTRTRNSGSGDTSPDCFTSTRGIRAS